MKTFIPQWEKDQSWSSIKLISKIIGNFYNKKVTTNFNNKGIMTKVINMKSLGEQKQQIIWDITKERNMKIDKDYLSKTKKTRMNFLGLYAKNLEYDVV